MKGKWLWLIGNFLIWGVPLIYLLAVAISITNVEATSTEGGRQIVFGTWSMVILGGLLIAYISRVRSMMKNALFVAQIKDGIVPPIWRVVQFIEFAVMTGASLLVIYAIQKLANPLYTFLLVSLFSGAVGYLFLILDSVGKVNRLKYERENLSPTLEKAIVEAVRKGGVVNEAKK